MSLVKNTATSNHSIPALDGLRAVAIVAVLLYHLFPATFKGGYLGVDIFFVISGFLITTLLIGEHLKTGKISLKKFWIRRARRLLPALLVTILVICSVMFFVRGDGMVGIAGQIFGALTFSSNWVEVASGTNYFATSTAHIFMNFWSLGVEEQFYLLWPIITIILVTKIKKPRIALLITGLLSLLSAGWMAYLYAHGASASRVYYGTDTHLFGLMIGAFIAYLSFATLSSQALRRLFQPFSFLKKWPIIAEIIAVAALSMLIYLCVTLSSQASFTYLGGLLGASTCSAIILMIAAGKRGVMQTFFQLPWLRWIGSRSYSIYLWHWPLIVLFHTLLPSLNLWLFSIFVIITTLAIAQLSYQFIELPVRRSGLRLILKKHFVTYSNRLNGKPRPHSLALLAFLAVLLTITSVITAPTKTSAQLRVEAGERLVKKQAETTKKITPPAHHPTIDGAHITAVGDSVMLASAPALEATYPGIFINAEISRSMRRGGLEVIQQLQTTHQLRDIVIIGLGTNGYFGAGKLDELMALLAGHKVVLVTAYADREWTNPNNQDITAIATTYPAVSIAHWDQLIAPHPELLSEDGIHPTIEGDALYISAISTALSKFE